MALYKSIYLLTYVPMVYVVTKDQLQLFNKTTDNNQMALQRK